MATKIFRMRDNYGNKEQYPFLEIENGKFYEMRDKFGNKEQYPFLEIDGRFSIADLIVILMQIGQL